MIRLLSLTDAPNPVGEPKEVEAIELQLTALATQWDSEVKEAASWTDKLKPWKWGRKVNLFKLTNFLLKSLDQLVQIVDGLVIDDLKVTGPDKKATVLLAISRLYDYVIREALPIWLRPFSGAVKEYIINTLLSTTIDWAVDKYKNGEWRDKIKPTEDSSQEGEDEGQKV